MSNYGEGIDPTWEAASQLEISFAQLWVATYPDVDLYTEFRFSRRRFRFDFCCPDAKVAIELQGGIWVQGGHSTGAGITKDYEKINLAQQLGWQVFLLTANDYHAPAKLAAIATAIQSRKAAIPCS